MWKRLPWRWPPAIPALRVENKRGSVALHYRQAPELEQECLHAMQAAVEDSPGLTLLRGKMVVEAKPGGASKGHAIEAFMQEAAVRRAARRCSSATTSPTRSASPPCSGSSGLGVKVGEGASVAWQRLASPAAFRYQLASRRGRARPERSTHEHRRCKRPSLR